MCFGFSIDAVRLCDIHQSALVEREGPMGLGGLYRVRRSGMQQRVHCTMGVMDQAGEVGRKGTMRLKIRGKPITPRSSLHPVKISASNTHKTLGVQPCGLSLRDTHASVVADKAHTRGRRIASTKPSTCAAMLLRNCGVCGFYGLGRLAKLQQILCETIAKNYY